jgi:nitrite reductase/ring-hydroxylating ferredoxin subunit
VAARERLICSSADLAERGDGVRFVIDYRGESVGAFAIRYHGRVHAYVNRCAHVPVELDWQPGKFFDIGRRLLICSTHGAVYAPASGQCLGGPCSGGALVPLPVEERDGKVILKEYG